VVNPYKTKTFYLRNAKKQPVVCIVFAVSEDGKSVRFGHATHNPCDKFSKREGRTIAAGRFVIEPAVIPLTAEHFGASNAIVEHLYEHPYNGRMLAVLRENVQD
jgi:hypothetical protein